MLQRVAGIEVRSRTPRTRPCCLKITSSRASSRATTSCCGMTRVTRISIFPITNIRASVSIAVRTRRRGGTSGPTHRPRACARAWGCCRRCFRYASAKTAFSAAAHVPVCNIRSSAAPRVRRLHQRRGLCRGCAPRRPVLGWPKPSGGRGHGEAHGCRCAALDYETAAGYRDRIAALRQVQERQSVSGEEGDADIIAIVLENSVACVGVTFIRNGRNLGNKLFFPRLGEASDVGEKFCSPFSANII